MENDSEGGREERGRANIPMGIEFGQIFTVLSGKIRHDQLGLEDP